MIGEDKKVLNLRLKRANLSPAGFVNKMLWHGNWSFVVISGLYVYVTKVIIASKATGHNILLTKL